MVHVDGGARGNPGPAAIGVVVSDPDGTLLDEHHETIGEATNNVAEYEALIAGALRARGLGATEVELVNDSELVAKQVLGQYRVKQPHLRPLHQRALEVLEDFDRWTVRSVKREQNADADALVNQALDGARG